VNKIKKLFLVVILLVLISSVYSEICNEEVYPDTECEIITPVISCGAYNYDLINLTLGDNGVLVNDGTMTQIGTTSSYNFTFNQPSGEYLIILCDNSTSYINVRTTQHFKIDNITSNQTAIFNKIDSVEEYLSDLNTSIIPEIHTLFEWGENKTAKFKMTFREGSTYDEVNVTTCNLKILDTDENTELNQDCQWISVGEYNVSWDISSTYTDMGMHLAKLTFTYNGVQTTYYKAFTMTSVDFDVIIDSEKETVQQDQPFNIFLTIIDVDEINKDIFAEWWVEYVGGELDGETIPGTYHAEWRLPRNSTESMVIPDSSLKGDVLLKLRVTYKDRIWESSDNIIIVGNVAHGGYVTAGVLMFIKEKPVPTIIFIGLAFSLVLIFAKKLKNKRQTEEKTEEVDTDV